LLYAVQFLCEKLLTFSSPAIYSAPRIFLVFAYLVYVFHS
jgi:hypothetical protein